MSLTCFVKRWSVCCQSIGGVNDMVTLGARVGIKPNLTGVHRWDETEKPLDTELFVTHPAVVNALGEALLDRGVGKLVRSDNHLALAHKCGLGTNVLDEIEIVGPRIQDVIYKFKPAI